MRNKNDKNFGLCKKSLEGIVFLLEEKVCEQT